MHSGNRQRVEHLDRMGCGALSNHHERKETKIMTKTLLTLAMLLLSAPVVAHADDDLPLCAADGDKDGDGIADSSDQTEDDSCTLTDTGYEDCETGAGDGLPDCR